MDIETTLLMYLLVLTRIGTFFVSMPILSMRQIPSIAKLGIILSLSFMAVSWVPTVEVEATTLIEFGLLVGREAVLGLGLGWITNMIFLSIQAAGDWVDFFAGLKMSASYDPISGASGSVYSNLYNWLGAVLFLAMNGHHYLLKGIVNSCFFIPVGQGKWLTFELDAIVSVATNSFLIGIQLALPMCIILFLVDVVLGLINRSVPQINVFILGMPLKLIVSFLMMILLISGLTRSIAWALDSVVQILDEAIRFMLV